MNLVVDASNIRAGGGVTHLCNVLAEGDPAAKGIDAVEVWTSASTAARFKPRPWLQVRGHPWMERGTAWRTLWQKRELDRELRGRRDTLLWAPGGSYIGSYRPFVTMSRSLLPFEPETRHYYRRSLKGVRLALLRRSQARTLRSSQGAIFLTDFARQRVLDQIGSLRCPVATIAHGISPDFFCKPRPARAFETFTPEAPAQLVYVSHISFYKHHIQVMEAMRLLRERGVPAKLTLIGQAAEPAAHQAFLAALHRIDPKGAFVEHIGGVPHDQLSQHYQRSDLFVFASGVETFGNVVVEAMAAGLPIASSNRSAMPEVIGKAGVFFDPTNPVEMAAAIEDVLRRTEFRADLAERAYRRAGDFSWRKCADATFGFLRDCYLGWSTAA